MHFLISTNIPCFITHIIIKLFNSNNYYIILGSNIFFIYSKKKPTVTNNVVQCKSVFIYYSGVQQCLTFGTHNAVLFIYNRISSNNIPKIWVNFEHNVSNNMHCDKYEKTSCCNPFNSQRFRRSLIFWLKTNGRFNYFIVDVSNRKFLLISKEGYSGYLHSEYAQQSIVSRYL